MKFQQKYQNKSPDDERERYVGGSFILLKKLYNFTLQLRTPTVDDARHRRSFFRIEIF